jgi:hypothetical protein
MMTRTTTRPNQRPNTLMQDRKADRSMKPSATHGRTIHSGHFRTKTEAFKAYQGNVQLNAQRAAIQATDENAPQPSEVLDAREGLRALKQTVLLNAATIYRGGSSEKILLVDFGGG